MSVNGSNNFLNIEDANLRVRNGSVHAQGMTIGGAIVSASHGLQSVSDTSNTTSNTLQFTNATTAFKATSNIELTSASKIIVDSNVVTEYTGPHDRPLRKYPEVALSVTSESASGEYGYKVSWSSIYDNGNNVNERPFRAFDGDIGNTGIAWMVPSGVYGLDGTYAYNPPRNLGTATGSSTTVNGEYIILQTPNKIKVKHFRISDRSTNTDRAAEAGKLYGSNDGSTWYELASFSGLTYFDGDYYNTVQVNAATYYDRLALVVTNSTATSTTFMGIGELEYYGYEEGSGSLDTTLKTVYNVPATTGTQLEVYYDAKGESTVQSPIPDFSPNTNTGAVVGHSPTLDETDGIESFKFNGSSQYVTGTHGLTTGSDPVHTISLWFKRIAKVGQFEYLVQLGQGGTSHQQSAIFIDDDKIGHGHWGSGVYQTDVITDNVWYHVAATFTGGNTSDLSTHKIYVNGVEKGINAYSSDGPLVLTGTALTLGRNENALGSPGGYFNGSIANFRLYSKALNADQVKELYDYQKDYFLGSKSQVTLYKGHLGVGVTEPSGQLELAGDERIQEYPPRDITVLDYHTHIEGHGEFEFYSSQSDPAYRGSSTWDFTRVFTPRFTTDGGWIGDGHSASFASVPPGTYQIVGVYAPAVTSGLGLRQSILKDGSAVLGEWIEMRSPYAINVTRIATAPRLNYGKSRGIGKFVILGSNNGTDWENTGNGAIAPHDISSTTDAGGYGTFGSETIAQVSTNSNGYYYTYHRLVVTHIMGHRGASGHPQYNSGASESVNQSYLRFFGTPGPTTLDKGSLTLGRSLDVPRVSRYDVDTETPRPEKLLVDFDTTVNSSPTDISGKGNHGRFYGTAQYSPADKAFKFDGDNDYIQTGSGSNVISGSAPPFTASVWVNNNSSDSTYASVFSIEPDTYGTNTNVWFYILSGKPTLQFENNYVEFYEPGTSTGGTTRNIWHHLVVSYNGNSTIGGRRCWLNGVEQTSSAVAGSGNLTLGTTRLTLGVLYYGNNHVNDMTGKISNFKLYDVALEPSEVQKLYRLGRTGRSMVISDTAVGIGKAPEAQLDVRGTGKFAGDLYLNEPPVLPQVIGFHAYSSTLNTFSGNSSITNQFDLTYYNYNSCYNTSTGIFTAPVAGLYGVELQLRTKGNYYCVYIELKSASGSLQRYVINQCEQDVTTTNEHRNMAGFTWMEAGGTLRIRTSGGSGDLYVDTGSWSKYVAVLIHKTP